MILTDAAVHTTGVNWESVAVIVSAIAAVISPLIIFLIRTTIKWTRVEDQLTEVVADVKELVIDKERAHSEIVTNMTKMAEYLDRRIRWVEEHIWDSERK